MRKIAIYGKGGIGKSTTASNLSAALAESGQRVMQVGCDPKADSTYLLTGGKKLTPILEKVREGGMSLPLEALVAGGYHGIYCAEAGGPEPGRGCAGRGIIAAFETLSRAHAFEVLQPDIVIYDVLGDVVCGGFAMPIREGYADKVFVVTSGENMSLHAAANIASAVDYFRDRGYATLGGLIENCRNVPDEDKKVAELAHDLNTVITGRIDFSRTVQLAEEMQKTVIEAFPDSEAAAQYRRLAAQVLACAGDEEAAQ